MDKKYTLQGIIGCVLFGIGDWLLEFVDPAKVNGDVFYFISAGHCAEYPSLKITITIVTAVIGVLFMHQGCTHISDLMKNDKDKAEASRVFAFLTFAWLILHFVVSFLYGLIGIILLTAYCLIGAFAVPQIAYWTMTPNAQKLLEEYGISRKFNLKGKISFAILTAVICALYLITIISAGKQGVNSGMNFWQLCFLWVRLSAY